MAKNNQFCYMCGKSVNEVNKLIKGEYGYICDSCISIASDLLNDEEEESITNNMQLATPSQIKDIWISMLSDRMKQREYLQLRYITTIRD